jgi:hypothetical protein
MKCLLTQTRSRQKQTHPETYILDRREQHHHKAGRAAHAPGAPPGSPEHHQHGLRPPTSPC